jgi:hypothetical protein
MKTILAAAAMTLAFAGAVQAQAVTATLRAPLPKPRHLVIDATVWECRDSQCTATLANQETDTWQACKALVRRTGAVAAFAALTEADLAKCNGAPAAK